ncbi:MAG: SRPBCC family protein [Devosia sp.]
MFASRLIKVIIERPYGQVYEFLADPLNFARWATLPGTDVEPLGGSDWMVEVPRGKIAIRFTPRNNFGVLDYQTFPPGEDGGPVTPVRLYPNGEGAELVLTWFQREGVTDERFQSDAEWVESDLQRLKSLIEGI